MPEPQTDPTPGALAPAGGSPGAADPAREERQARVEAESQSYRSLRGRFKALGIDQLDPEKIAEYVKLGQEAKAAKPQDPDPDDPESQKKLAATTVPKADFTEALKRERDAHARAQGELQKKLEAERDQWKLRFLESGARSEVGKILGEDQFSAYEAAYVFDAFASERVPFRPALDEESGALIMVDKKTGEEYRDPETRAYLPPREALAKLPTFAPYVKRGVIPGGAAAGNTAAPARSNGKVDPNKMTTAEKVALAFGPPPGR